MNLLELVRSDLFTVVLEVGPCPLPALPSRGACGLSWSFVFPCDWQLAPHSLQLSPVAVTGPSRGLDVITMWLSPLRASRSSLPPMWRHLGLTAYPLPAGCPCHC